MSSAIAGSGVTFARLLQRPVQQAVRCNHQQYLRLRAQQQRRPNARSFVASARAFEKRYTQDHEWIEASEDMSNASIGISTYAATALGDVVFVELPTVETEFNKGDAIGAVESVKSASDIMTPVSGTITEVNSVLEDKPGTINKSPEGDGWLAKISVADKAELEGLMDAEAYRVFTEEAGGEDH